MTKVELFNGVSRAFHKVGFGLKKRSPEILIVGGIIGVVASTVVACKATTKLDTILDESKEKVDAIHEATNNPDLAEVYTKEDSKKDLAIVYAQTGLKVAKLYAPAVLLGAASLGAIITSHNIINKRNVALATAYAAVESSFKDYRGRVVERFGESLDKELRYNIKAKEVEVVETDEEGKEKKVKKTVEVSETNHPIGSPFAQFFDNGNPNWIKDAEANKMFLLQQQNWANEKLQRQGHLFLNEVYDMLGMRRTQVGNVAGWRYDPKNPNIDSCVDFMLFDVHDPDKRRFINGDERTVLVDFNCDGDILSDFA